MKRTRSCKPFSDQLDLWISESPANACLFLEDRAEAMRVAAAKSALDLSILIELEAVLSGLAQKLELPVTKNSGKKS